MLLTATPADIHWSLAKKILFRFFFIFMMLYMAPWTWLDGLFFELKIQWLTAWYSDAEDWAVRFANEKIFHVKEVLVPVSGSGDTSWGWAQLWLFLMLGVVGCITWSVVDFKRKNYVQLDYWFCLITRYYLALFAFLYGVIKLFLLQMSFPSLSMMATPLGDLLPMRLSWMFMGYSSHYQFFSGLMEAITGLLLLHRRTATLGTAMAAGVFLNVMMMNLSYDIPVKIFSMRLVLFSLVLLAHEKDRLLSFFIKNETAVAGNLYNVQFTKKWLRISRIVLKTIFIGVAFAWTAYTTYERYLDVNKPPEPGPIATGVYDVSSYVLNKDTIPPLLTDTIRWQEIIFENGGGSIKTTDTAFRIRYRRAFFNYQLDSTGQNIIFRKTSFDPNIIASFRFEKPDSSTIKLWGKFKNDSLILVLKKSNRHFQLGERQFHWLSEANR